MWDDSSAKDIPTSSPCYVDHPIPTLGSKADNRFMCLSPLLIAMLDARQQRTQYARLVVTYMITM